MEEVSNRFTVKIGPKDGESLSGFLVRFAEANYYPVKYIIRNIKEYENDNFSRRHFRLDFYPLSDLSFTYISSITGASVTVLKSMTAYPIYNKLLDRIVFNSNKKIGLDENQFENRYRKFCPQCMRENKSYKLIWQIKAIEICNLHSTKLLSKCSKCNRELKYIDRDMFSMKCPYCDTEYNSICIDDKIIDIDEQKRIYKYWEFLLDDNAELVKTIPGFGKQKSFALVYLFIALQEWKNSRIIFNNERSKFSLLDIYNIEEYVRTNQEYQIGLIKLKRLLDYSAINIDKLNEIVVAPDLPNRYLDTDSRVNNDPGNCYSTWCKSFNTNSAMIEFSGFRRRKEGKFTQTYICNDCSIIYGVTKHGNWECYYRCVEAVKSIFEMVIGGISLDELLSTKTGFTEKEVSTAFGYIKSHKLIYENGQIILSENYNQDFYEKYKEIVAQIDENKKLNVTQLKSMVENNEDFHEIMNSDYIRKLSLDKYMITHREKYSSDQLKNIIMEILNELITQNAKVTKAKIISMLKVAKDIFEKYKLTDFIDNILSEDIDRRKSKLKNQIHSIFENEDRKNTMVKVSEIYKEIGVSKKYVVRLDANLHSFIIDNCIAHNSRCKKNERDLLIRRIQVEKMKLIENGETVYMTKIVKILGIKKSCIVNDSNLRKLIQGQ